MPMSAPQKPISITSSQLHNNQPDATTKLPEIEEIRSESWTYSMSNIPSAKQNLLWSQQSHSHGRFVTVWGWMVTKDLTLLIRWTPKLKDHCERN